MKDWVLGCGIVAILLGIMGLPMGSRENPKFSTSIFYSFADLGLFFDFAIVLVVVGVVLVALSFAIRGDNKKRV